MKKLRRIEITTYRRRTSVVLRGKAEGEATASLRVDASLPTLAGSAKATGTDRNQSGHASAGPLEIPEGRNEIVTKEQAQRATLNRWTAPAQTDCEEMKP